jgi:hypothetical protein
MQAAFVTAIDALYAQSRQEDDRVDSCDVFRCLCIIPLFDHVGTQNTRVMTGSLVSFKGLLG